MYTLNGYSLLIQHIYRMLTVDNKAEKRLNQTISDYSNVRTLIKHLVNRIPVSVNEEVPEKAT